MVDDAITSQNVAVLEETETNAIQDAIAQQQQVLAKVNGVLEDLEGEQLG